MDKCFMEFEALFLDLEAQTDNTSDENPWQLKTDLKHHIENKKSTNYFWHMAFYSSSFRYSFASNTSST